jgi:phosphatidylethanolamine-binding protein (PEBP) family uncharacterized protein
LKSGATKAQIEEAMKGHVLAQAELIGLYRRKHKGYRGIAAFSFS